MMADPLDALRALMASHYPPLDALVVPSEDNHQSEYVSTRDKRRAFVSGFTGSAGLALITMNEALLWTDGRYFLQATQQLSERWKLMRIGEDPPVENWMADNLPHGAAIGTDPWCVSVETYQRWEQAFLKKKQKLIQLSTNMVDAVWKDRPPAEILPVNIHPPEFAGCTVAEKLKDLKSKLIREKAYGIIISSLDEVAWLYNVRGNDVAYCPVIHAYAVVTLDSAFFYVDKRKVSSEVLHYMLENGIDVRDYDIVASDQAKILLACMEQSPLALAKAIKNPAELNGLRKAHIRDGAAVVQFLVWLDKQMQEIYGASGYFSEREGTHKRKHSDTLKLTEVSVSDKLEGFRAKQENFRGLSFPTISSVGPNAAIIHYSPEADTCSELDADSIYLFDSGGQYIDGTTDITRTVHFGKPSAHEKSCYTAVLKGHIALGRARFPNGTTGHALDILARVPLWKNGLDYRHGTGHGIGSYLNVHEGPHLISFRPHARNVAIQASMTVTDEPGYYEDGNFGIRLENVLIVNKAKTSFNFGEKGYLEFEHITWAPYQKKLMDLTLLTPEEIEWINCYHSDCREAAEAALGSHHHTIPYFCRGSLSGSI
ncbi:hypothetical protein OPV22_013907 [Ensete ventricosum]|uniref:Aminopeptidase P N-terminal domain-containing protein n=1 Tax=Ensete ventricosum TaxID=4639 RepID=A0AAV8R4Z2_ENSVE|nr:hypothetical protein OPV22_013907 [Ensete ventricosum]